MTYFNNLKSKFTPTSEGENENSFSFFRSAVGANAQRAFTLIELLVVIAIIGILSSVVLASLNGARADARDSRRAQDMSQIRTAMELCANDTGDYSQCTDDAELAPDYIQSVPNDPSDDAIDYTITSTDGSEYCISTAEWEGDDVPDNDTNCAGNYSLGSDGAI